MEEIGSITYSGMGQFDGEEEPEAYQRSRVFTELKVYSVQILELLQNPNQTNFQNSKDTLHQFHHFLRVSPSQSLQPFFGYTLFPLLLLLDAVVDSRSQHKVDSKEKSMMFIERQIPAVIPDSLAECTILCLEEVLKKCLVGSVNELTVVLKKLTYGAMLSSSVVAEEFREGVVRCFKALLLNIHQCDDKSCSCQQVFGVPALQEDKDLPYSANASSENNTGPRDCLLAFLQSQTASAAVGHWLSLLLTAADNEAVRGLRGSASLRIEAFKTLRILVAKVGVGDSLAFFLPGVVSQFSKVLHVSKSMISGAAGSMEATEQAIRGLAEYLMIVLRDDSDMSGSSMSQNRRTFTGGRTDGSLQSVLNKLRQLPNQVQSSSDIGKEGSSDKETDAAKSNCDVIERGIPSGKLLGSFYIDRTKEWLEKTSGHVNKLLASTFPSLCLHHSRKVRRGLLVAIHGLLTNCSCTLKESRQMLLECLFSLVCDDSEDVAATAREFLGYFFSTSMKYIVEQDVIEIFKRLIEKLPKLVLGSEESNAVSHAHQLLVVIYYSGPQLVVDHLLRSPITAARFLDIFAACLSQNSVFAGSLDKLMSISTSSTGYLHSLTELKAGTRFTTKDRTSVQPALLEAPKFFKLTDEEMKEPADNVLKVSRLPRMPPWFVYVGSQKLYEALATILRLVGLSLMADSSSNGFLSTIIDIPLSYLRKLVSEFRAKECSKESWQSWYYRMSSGQLLRQASTSVFMMNEMIFGVSDRAFEKIQLLFQPKTRYEEARNGVAENDDHQTIRYENLVSETSWKMCCDSRARNHLIDCVGNILHEYLCPEVWNLPIDYQAYLQQPDIEAEGISLYFFRDTAMLQQVIIDGIGIFSMCLGKHFATSGFLHSSLYLLLENLISSSFEIRSASDVVLHILASTVGSPTVGHLVMENSDYVIDSICRQLRHLDLNPHVPNVLAAMLSYVGVAHKIIPLLEEPMKSVSLELEILGRHQHPDLTIPFLKAIAEIAKSAKLEASSMPIEAESVISQIESKMSDVEKKARLYPRESSFSDDDDVDIAPIESDANTYKENHVMPMEEWENIMFNLNDLRRYRRTVGSIIGSSLTAATPLLASDKQKECLVALDIIEDGISALAAVEAAYKHETEAKELMKLVCQCRSYYHLQDALDTAEDGTDENRLLPAANKIWPVLVVCVRNKYPVVAQRCLDVVSSVVQICGGDFFSRRFHNDGSHFWKLLSSSPFQKKSFSKEDRIPLQLPYRSGPISSEDSVAEASSLKVQVAMLNMIANLSKNRRSASALEVVLKKVSGLVVGIACSGVSGLRNASINALVGLASIDPDLIWLLLADVYYSLIRKELPSPPTTEFPGLSQMLPPPLSRKGYLYAQYGGQTYGFDVDFASAEVVFKQFNSKMVT